MFVLHHWFTIMTVVVASIAAFPTSYTRIDGLGFYRAFDTPASWTQALKACYQDKGSLVELSSDAEAAAVGRLLREAGVNRTAFVGIHNFFNQDMYLYISGSPLSEDVLSLLETSNLTTNWSRCGVVDGNGGVSMKECVVGRPYVCKLPLWRGYEYVNGRGYYRLSEEAVTWEEARASCERDGAHLVVINSPAEAKMLTGMMERHPYTPESSNSTLAAVGVHDQFWDGFYFTVKGEPLEQTGFSTWVPDKQGKFFTKRDKRCVFLHRKTSYLANGRCGDRHVFICEREMPDEDFRQAQRRLQGVTIYG